LGLGLAAVGVGSRAPGAEDQFRPRRGAGLESGGGRAECAVDRLGLCGAGAGRPAGLGPGTWSRARPRTVVGWQWPLVVGAPVAGLSPGTVGRAGISPG